MKKVFLLILVAAFFLGCSAHHEYLENLSSEKSLSLKETNTKIIKYDDFPDGGGITLQYLASKGKWPKNNITYAFKNFTTDLQRSQIQNSFRTAFALWASESPLLFSEISDYNSADIVITFAIGSHGDNSPFDNGGSSNSNVLAHTFYPAPVNPNPIAGDMHFDDYENWALDSSQGIDLVSVAAHEIGHALGLGHSSDSKALMYSYYSGNHRHLSIDDIQGIRLIYGYTSNPGDVFRYWNGKNHFYTNDWNELGYSSGKFEFEKVGFNLPIVPETDFTRPVYRLFHPSTGDHFYTTSDSEKNGAIRLGYRFESILGYASDTPKNNAIPVYGYWDGHRDHFYTTDWSELENGRSGWKFEKIRFYSRKVPL